MRPPSTARSLVASVALAACAARPPTPPVALAAPLVAPAVVAPVPAVAPDAVELRAASPSSWELVNHTPVAIEPVGRADAASSPLGVLGREGSPFQVSFERLGFEGRWVSLHDFPMSDAPADLTPLAPGASRPVQPSSFSSDYSFSAGTWRAVVRYRDPRHPASPAVAETTFDLVGLSPAQAEEMLAIVADPSRRACEWVMGFAEDFARTAPLAMLPRLLELPGETVAERQRALGAITAATHDETLLRRGLQEDDPAVRLAAARAVARALSHTSTADNNRLWLLSMMEILPRVMAAAPIDAEDAHALFAIFPDWSPEMLERVLQRVADPQAREVGVALALRLGASTSRFSHAALARIRDVLVRTAAQLTDPAARAHYQTAIRDCTVALNARPGEVHYSTDSGLASVTLETSGAHVPEGCRPDDEARREMGDFARHLGLMRFVLRDEGRRAATPGPDPSAGERTSAERPVRVYHPTCGLAMQDRDAHLRLFEPGGGRLSREMMARGIECVRDHGRVAWALPPTTARPNYVEALREVYCGLTARMYAVEASHDPNRYRLEIARMDFESAHAGAKWAQADTLFRAPEQALDHDVRIEARVQDLHVDGSVTAFSAVLDGGLGRVAVTLPSTDARIANGVRVVAYGVVNGSSVERRGDGDRVVPEVMAFLVVPQAEARAAPAGSPTSAPGAAGR